MILVASDKIGEYTRNGWWGTTTLWDSFLQQMQARPDVESVSYTHLTLPTSDLV